VEVMKDRYRSYALLHANFVIIPPNSLNVLHR